MLKQIYYLIYISILFLIPLFKFFQVSLRIFFLRRFPSLMTLILVLPSIWYIALALQSHPINSGLCFRIVPRLSIRYSLSSLCRVKIIILSSLAMSSLVFILPFLFLFFFCHSVLCLDFLLSLFRVYAYVTLFVIVSLFLLFLLWHQ